MLPQQPHGIDIERIGGPPEGGRPLQIDSAAAKHAKGVLHIPEMAAEAKIRIGARREQRIQGFEVGGALAKVLGGVGIGGARCPLPLQDRKERGCARCAGQIGVGARFEQGEHKIELAIQRRHQKGGGAIAGALVDCGAPRQKCSRCGSMTLANRMVQRRQTAP